MTHPELVRIEDLVRRLEEGMRNEGEGVENKLFSLAGEYAELCRKTNERLQTCVEILSKGKDREYQALMAATRAPDVLDLCAVLSDLEMEEYRAFCLRNHLPVPEELNERAKQAIDPVYERAGSFQKTLMAEYSAANSKRDFQEALRVIRKVASLNPEDANSVKQAAALEERLLGELRSKLEVSLEKGDNTEAVAILEKIEELAPGRLPKEGDPGDDCWRVAIDLRKTALREAAIGEAESLIPRAEAAKAAGDLDEVLALVSRVSGLMEEHEFTLKPDSRALHGSLGEWAEEELRRWKLEEEFRSRLETLRTTLRSIRDKEFQNRQPGLDELEEDAMSIRRQWKEIAEFRKPVPNELQEEARKLLGELEAKIDLRRRAKRRNLIAAATGATTVFVLLAVISLFFWKAGQKSEQLKRALDGERAADLEADLKELEEEAPLWKGLAGLPSTVDRARSWLTLEQANADRVDGMISRIENDLEASPGPDAWTEVSLVALRDSIGKVKQQSAGVNADFQSGMADRISLIESEFQRIAGARRNRIAPEFHEKVLALDASLREALQPDRPPAELHGAVASMAEMIAGMDLLAQTPVEELRPLAADLTTFDILKQKHGALEEQVEGAREILARVSGAATVEEYVQAVGELAETDFIEGTARISLGELLRKVRSEEILLREVLLPGDLVRWSSLTEGKYAAAGFPDEVAGEEKGALLALRDDEALGEVFFYTVSEGGNSRPVYSLGDPIEFRDSRVGDAVQTDASGSRIYDPGEMGKEAVVFAEARYRKRVSPSGSIGFVPVGGRLSPESTFYRSIRIDGLMDPAVSRYRGSLLQALEKLFEAEEAVSPVFLAFLQLQLGDVISNRKSVWLTDFTEFDGIQEKLENLLDGETLTSRSWMAPEVDQRLRGPLSEYYRQHRGVRLARPALAAYQFFARMRAAGIEYVGYVDFDESNRIVKEPGDAGHLWGLDGALKVTRVMRNNGGAFEPLTTIRRFSPLFVLRAKPVEVISAAAGTASIDPEDPFFRQQLPVIFQSDSQ